MRAAKKSLERLGTYIDLYLIHNPHNANERLNLEALEDLKEWKVKSIGVSNYGVHH